MGIVDWLLMKITSNDKKAFLWSIIFGLISHLYMIVNKLPLADDLAFSFTPNAGMATTSGRWFLEVYYKLEWSYNVPAIKGILSVVFLACAYCVITRILRIQKTSNLIIGAFVFMSFPFFASILTQMYMADAYCFGMLLSCLGAYLVCGKQLWKCCVGIVLLSISMGIYQSLVIFAIVLLYFEFFNSMVRNENSSIRMELKTIAKFAIALIVSYILYYLILRIVLKIMGATLSSYQGINEMAKLSISSVKKSILDAYKYFVGFITGKVFTRNMLILNIIVLVIALAGIAVNFKGQTIASIVIEIVMLIIYPVTCGFIYFMAPNAYVYSLQLTQYVLIYIELIFLIEYIYLKQYDCIKGHIKTLCNCAISLMQITCIIIAFLSMTKCAKLYYDLFLTYEATYSYYTQLISDIKTSEYYTDASNVSIVAEGDNDELWDIGYVDELKDFGWDIKREMIINASQYGPLFAKYYLGFDLHELSTDELQQLEVSEEYKDMPPWPIDGSMKRIGDLMIVKIGQPEEQE